MFSDKYKLLIVDDEEDARNGMFYDIDWAALGYCAVAQACDGLEAICKIKEYLPDVVMTDIRMGNMDGMQLIDYIAQNYPNIRVVLVSGYSDLEYYQKAIRLKIYDYILKPTHTENFNQVFSKLKKEMDEVQSQSRQLKNMEQEIQESLQLTKTNFLTDLLRGKMFTHEELEQKKKKLGVHLQNKDLVVISFAVLQARMHKANEITPAQEYDFIAQEMQEQGFPFCRELLVYEEDVVCICNCCAKEQPVQMLYSIAAAIKEKKGVCIFSGVSDKCSEIALLNTYLAQAQIAMHQMIFLDEESVVLYSSVVKETESHTIRHEFSCAQCVNDLFWGNIARCEEEIDKLFAQFQGTMRVNYDYLDCICNNLYYAAVRQAEQMNLSFFESENFYEQLSRQKTLGEKRHYVGEMLKSLYYMTEDIKQNGKAKIAMEIEAVIDENYCDSQLSLNMIADKIGRNTSYISSLYKQETGKNIVDDITLKRVDKAKYYLENTNLKTYVIAEKIGYQDCSYFAKTFKKIIGVGPSEYRLRAKQSVSENEISSMEKPNVNKNI